MEKDISSDTEYSETLESIRHYSNMRFASLTVFSAISGGLFEATFGTIFKDDAIRTKTFYTWAVAGLVASALFLLLECCITSFIIAFYGHAKEINPGGHFTKPPFLAHRLARLMFAAVYSAMIVFWLAVIFGWI